MQDFTLFKVIFAVVGGLVAQFLGGWDLALKVLISLMVIDCITGVISAIIRGERIRSSVTWTGILKKTLVLFLVGVAALMDQYTGTAILRGAVIGFYIAVEGISILENCARAGILLPDSLRSVFNNERGETKWKPESFS